MTRWGLRNVQLFNRPLLHHLLFGGNEINFGAAPVGQSPHCALRNGNVGHVTRWLAMRSATGRKEPTLGDLSSSLPLLFFLSSTPFFLPSRLRGGCKKHLRPLRGKQAGVNLSFPAVFKWNTNDLPLHSHKGAHLDIDQCDMSRKMRVWVCKFVRQLYFVKQDLGPRVANLALDLHHLPPGL